MTRIRKGTLSRTSANRGMGGMVNRNGPGKSPDGDSANLNFVNEGVTTAYKVIDAYLRQGQVMARQMNQLYSVPVKMTGNMVSTQNRWLQLYGDLMKNWVELAALYGDSMATVASASTATDGNQEPSNSDGEAVPVAWSIDSKRPVRVILEWQPGRASRHISSPGLVGPDAKPLKVGFESRGSHAPVVISVKVPKKRKPGAYKGFLEDTRTGLVAGSLILQVG